MEECPALRPVTLGRIRGVNGIIGVTKRVVPSYRSGRTLPALRGPDHPPLRGREVLPRRRGPRAG